ncbi:MAG: ribosomal protein L16, partial [Candidatus Dadabacteria bacterium]|nr:ribosomal protein L16 [Candidatus Dadabacteria bacterium]
MLQPKNSKYRKQFKGRNKGKATKGATVAFGEYGLQTLEHGKITSRPKPADGSLRIVGTGHSFMAPGYRTFPKISQAAGFKQQTLFTHTGGGIT